MPAKKKKKIFFINFFKKKFFIFIIFWYINLKDFIKTVKTAKNVLKLIKNMEKNGKIFILIYNVIKIHDKLKFSFIDISLSVI